MRKATQLATAGAGIVMLDQSAAIDARLAQDNAIELRPWRATCQAAPGASARPLALLALLTLLATTALYRRRSVTRPSAVRRRVIG
jgi:MYXO-CTERM domain-containing protein